jgi:hypothetical protein
MTQASINITLTAVTIDPVYSARSPRPSTSGDPQAFIRDTTPLVKAVVWVQGRAILGGFGTFEWRRSQSHSHKDAKCRSQDRFRLQSNEHSKTSTAKGEKKTAVDKGNDASGHAQPHRTFGAIILIAESWRKRSRIFKTFRGTSRTCAELLCINNGPISNYGLEKRYCSRKPGGVGMMADNLLSQRYIDARVDRTQILVHEHYRPWTQSQ